MNVLHLAAIVAVLLFSGCTRKLPAELTKSEVEAKIRATQKWRDVSLQGPIDGKYTGKAVTEDGKKLNLNVHQSTDGISTDWKNADGSGSGNAKVN